MLKLLTRRAVSTAGVVVFVSFVVFALVDLAPGDPAYRLAGENPTAEQLSAIRAELRLDDPFVVRYVDWLGDAVRGDLGKSVSTGVPVSDLIADRMFVTLSLTAVALVLAFVIGLPLGILAAVNSGRLLDRLITIVGSVSLAVPSFWLGMLLVSYLAIRYGWFPAIGYEPTSEGWGTWLRHLFLPAVALSILPGAELSLQLKGSLIEVLKRDYILTGRARGFTPRRLVLKHALKNAAIPVVTVLGYRIAQLLGGTVIIESVFVLNGLGTLAVTSTMSSDLPVVLGLATFTAVIVGVVNLVVDLSYTYFNPKVRE